MSPNDQLGEAASIPNKLVPVTTDKDRILWDGNHATLEGILHEIGRFFKRTGLFQLLTSVQAPRRSAERRCHCH